MQNGRTDQSYAEDSCVVRIRGAAVRCAGSRAPPGEVASVIWKLSQNLKLTWLWALRWPKTCQLTWLERRFALALLSCTSSMAVRNMP